MIPNAREYASHACAEGRPVVGIMCEYAPRELIMAAGGLPVCLCGGDPDTISIAETELPANLCPLIKSTYGYLLEKSNPFLEMADLVVAETTCDGKKKMFELMGQRKPTYLLELPQKENDPAGLEQWVGELWKFKAFLEERYHTAITTEKLRAAIVVMNRERALRRALMEAMREDNPGLTGRQVLEFKSIISGQPADLAQYEQALRLLQGGARFRQDHGQPVRVLLTGVPLVHGAERVIEIIEAHGGLVVCQENCTGLKSILENVSLDETDLVRAMAVKYYHLPCSIHTPNQRRMDLLRQLATEYRTECVIDLAWQACLTYTIESLRVRRLAEEELGLPFLRIETDYSPADSPRLATRVEALMETARARRKRMDHEATPA
jgi:benzoyl-CoA reductase/2-hydroxyglutaryl-CoA dehydratase subunit BcrC/BadD/HgdB